MDGAGDGKAGSDYKTKITAGTLVILGKHPRAEKALEAILAKEKRVLATKRLHRVVSIRRPTPTRRSLPGIAIKRKG